MPSNGKNLFKEMRAGAAATLFLAVLVCVLYPAVVWLLGQGLFPEKAAGSLVVSEGAVLGSSLLAQDFEGAAYFHPRPSAAGTGYDAAQSGGTNLGPLSKKLLDRVRGRVEAYRRENELPADALVPADAVTSSASGLDPHISVANALIQARRVARARGMNMEVIVRRITSHTEGRTLGILGESRVNVLLLNLDLDGRL